MGFSAVMVEAVEILEMTMFVEDGSAISFLAFIKIVLWSAKVESRVSVPLAK
jgi:hypothetical protein